MTKIECKKKRTTKKIALEWFEIVDHELEKKRNKCKVMTKSQFRNKLLALQKARSNSSILSAV